MTTAQDVLDYIEWMWHCEWVHGLCDSTATALVAFESFQRTASAERGRSVAA